MFRVFLGVEGSVCRVFLRERNDRACGVWRAYCEVALLQGEPVAFTATVSCARLRNIAKHTGILAVGHQETF